MRSLRHAIRQILIEEYELSAEEEAQRQKDGSSTRAIGLQTPDEQAKDRKKMQDFNELLNTTPAGKKIIQQFRSGDGSIQVLHSITYFGIHTSREINWGKLFSSWLERRGIRGKDALSCVAINTPIGEAGAPWTQWRKQGLDHYNVDDVLNGCGFIMKGYPSYIATTDAMTHTLSALTPSAKKAWEDTSGLVKRPADWAEHIDLENWCGSDEVILDNWEVIGIYIGDTAKSYDYDAIMNDAMELEDQLGLFVCKVDGGDSSGPAKLVEV